MMPEPWWDAAVYPRVCGGTCTDGQPVNESCGLSPRVRGNQCGLVGCCRRQGSIPACAGEPFCRMLAQSSSRVYPRVCGGTFERRGRSGTFRGLSPRVRGNHPVRTTLVAPRGSIPACAGEPPAHDLAESRTGVYPRVCGGTVIGAAAEYAREGLSPRVRGNHSYVGNVQRIPRSIPACAGEPSTNA